MIDNLPSNFLIDYNRIIQVPNIFIIIIVDDYTTLRANRGLYLSPGQKNSRLTV